MAEGKGMKVLRVTIKVLADVAFMGLCVFFGVTAYHWLQEQVGLGGVIGIVLLLVAFLVIVGWRKDDH